MEARTRLYIERGAWGHIETGSKQKVRICVPKADKCCVAYGEIGTMRHKALVGAGMEIICAGEKQKMREKSGCVRSKTILQWTKRRNRLFRQKCVVSRETTQGTMRERMIGLF